jgi:hypothetical protein
VASIHIEGLKTCVESQKSNMARSYYVAHLQANLVDLVDECNGSIHWFIHISKRSEMLIVPYGKYNISLQTCACLVACVNTLRRTSCTEC